MSYFGGSGRMAGDPGFFGALKGFVGKALPIAAGLGLGGPLGAGIAAVARGRGRAPAFRPPGGTQVPVVRQPGVRAAISRVIPGGSTGLVVAPDGTVRRKRRRMNYLNQKALRRSTRRVDGFVREAKTALKNTGFKVVSKSAGKMTEAAFRKRAHHAK